MVTGLQSAYLSLRDVFFVYVWMVFFPLLHYLQLVLSKQGAQATYTISYFILVSTGVPCSFVFFCIQNVYIRGFVTRQGFASPCNLDASKSGTFKLLLTFHSTTCSYVHYNMKFYFFHQRHFNWWYNLIWKYFIATIHKVFGIYLRRLWSCNNSTNNVSAVIPIRIIHNRMNNVMKAITM